MREEMEYIGGVLDELEAVVREASRVPLRKGRVMVDRADFLVVLDELRGSLPGELSEAEAIRRECAAIVAEAEEEARRILEIARERAESKVMGTELYRRAQRRVQENLDRAERYAREVQDGSEVYQDRVMAQLEGWFEDSLVSVAESREELGGTPTRRAAERPPERRTEDDVERAGSQSEEEAFRSDDGGRREDGTSSWRANSA
jgi:cell division septum initiation protein DivIVA